ncbi:MAG: hypothetical protein O2V44_06555 [Candidatus Bathyarchaeota archaeon]|nr:hypothetical protein [Candidatus Bathyarchaeota archaeon]
MSALKFCILLLILAQVATSVSPATALGSEDEAALAIYAAEEDMAKAYKLVKEAETSGADISGFSALLKDAVQLLARAHTSFRVGDFEGAVRFANLTSEIGKEVEAKAYQLREFKRGLPVEQMTFTITVSFFAVLAIVITGFLSWFVFKRLYYRRIRAAKPEVASDES